MPAAYVQSFTQADKYSIPMDEGQMRSGAGISKELWRLARTAADAVVDVTRTLEQPGAYHEGSADSLAPR